jgi:hypothetical protein
LFPPCSLPTTFEGLSEEKSDNIAAPGHGFSTESKLNVEMTQMELVAKGLQ